MMCYSHPPRQCSRAFSLIEVLIGIVVLALGLLGLAAVFPAVIVQQRSTTESVQSLALDRTVRGLITSSTIYNKVSLLPASGVFTGADLRGWMTLIGEPAWGVPSTASVAAGNFDGAWDVGLSTNSRGVILDDDGTLHITGSVASGTPGTTPGFTVAAVDRKISNNAQQPFVWDIAARCVASGRPYSTDTARFGTNVQQLTMQDDALQLAVFIRRQDNFNPARVGPILIAEDNNRAPTNNGVGTYSHIRTLTVARDPAYADRDVIRVTLNSTDTAIKPAIFQLGQKLVSSWGTVYTVAAVRDFTRGIVQVKPEIPGGRISDRGQVTFIATPQIPVAVSIVDIQPQYR